MFRSGARKQATRIIGNYITIKSVILLQYLNQQTSQKYSLFCYVA